MILLLKHFFSRLIVCLQSEFTLSMANSLMDFSSISVDRVTTFDLRCNLASQCLLSELFLSICTVCDFDVV